MRRLRAVIFASHTMERFCKITAIRVLLTLGFLTGVKGAFAQLATGAPSTSSSGSPVQQLRVAQPNAARFPEISLFFTPTDAQHRYVSGLERPGALKVLENGKPVQVLGVDSNGNHLDICLALDSSFSMASEEKLVWAKSAAQQFVQQLGAEDQAALVSFAAGSTLEQPLGRDRQALQAAIQRLRPNGNTTTFYDALYWSITQVALRPGGSVLSATSTRADSRRVVVALTDGQDLSSRIQVDELVSYARANGVSLCLVALGQDAERNRLRWFAQETGGIYLEAPQPRDLEQLYSALARELRREYRLVFRTPQPQADATRRDVVVQVEGTAVSARTWYQAPGQGSLLVTVPAGAGPSAAVNTSGGAGSATSPMPVGVAVGIILGLLALAGGVVLLLVRQRATPIRLPIQDPNPRIDLMPLWVREGCTRVGRGAECELVLDSSQVSREHARIEAVGGAYRVVDAGSRNGTYVNGRRVKGSQIIQPGDQLRFGDREFSFAGELQAS